MADKAFDLLLLLLSSAAFLAERTESQSISGGPVSDSPKCVSGFCLQKGYQETHHNEPASVLQGDPSEWSKTSR